MISKLSINARSRFFNLSNFYNNVIKMSFGIFISQLIQATFLPFVVNFYTPTQFAVFNFFVTASTLLGLIATARLEFAIVVDEEKDIINVIFTPLVLVMLNCLLMFFIIQLFEEKIYFILREKEIHSNEIFLTIPCMAMLIGVGQIFSNISNRFGQYAQLAFGTVLFQLIFASFAICIGYYHRENGLIIARYVGQACLLVIFAFQLKHLIPEFGAFSKKKVVHSLRKNYKFTLYGLPYSLIHTFSKEFILFILLSFGHLETAGLFSLVRNIMLAPITFIGASIGKVYYKEAAENIGTLKLQELTVRLMNGIISLSAPTFIFFMFWASEIFNLIFNAAWSRGSIYAVYLVPSTLLYLFTCWTEKLFEVTGKQNISLTVQILSDVILIILASGTLYLGVSPEKCCITYSLSLCLYHLAYLFMAFKISNFDLKEFWFLISRLITLSISFGLIFYIISLFVQSIVFKFLFDLIILSIYLLIWLKKEFFWKNNNIVAVVR